MQAFKNKPIKDVKILIIGDIMIDHYIYGSCNRISPEAPVPVVEVKNEEYILGGAGNVLRNLVSFNCRADIVCVTGEDEDAIIINNYLSNQNIKENGLVKDGSRCTTIKSRVLVSNHQLIRLDKENTHPISDSIAEQLIAVIKKSIQDYDIVLLSDYNKGLFTSELLSQIFSVCRAANVKTILDPKTADFTKYRGVNVIKPNKKEAIAATGIIIKDTESLRAACAKIKKQTECDDVVITMSEEGMAFYSDGALTIIPTKALDVVDVTGAGDTVLASLGVALAAGNSLLEACDFANHAAAVVVSKVGSAIATLQEIYDKATN